MTKHKAIKTAQKRVAIVSYDHGQHRVQVYRPDLQAVMEGWPSDYWRARAQAREEKITIALELMGWPNDEAAAEAYCAADKSGDWRLFVRAWQNAEAVS